MTESKKESKFSNSINDVFTYGNIIIEDMQGTKVEGKNLDNIHTDIVKVILFIIIASMISLNAVWLM